MLHVARWLFRLDYKPVYGVLDRLGGGLEIIDGVNRRYASRNRGDDLWTKLAINDTHNPAAEHADDETSLFRSLVVAPTFLVANSEDSEPCRADVLFESVEFKGMAETIDSVIDHYDIGAARRVGFRMWLFDVGDVAGLPSRLGGVAEDARTAVESALGSVTDIGCGIDGQMPNERGAYHFRFGPYRNSEIEKYFTKVRTLAIAGADPSLVYDIDLYEHNIDIGKYRGVEQWMRPMFEDALRATHQVQSTQGVD